MRKSVELSVLKKKIYVCKLNNPINIIRTLEIHLYIYFKSLSNLSSLNCFPGYLPSLAHKFLLHFYFAAIFRLLKAVENAKVCNKLALQGAHFESFFLGRRVKRLVWTEYWVSYSHSKKKGLLPTNCVKQASGFTAKSCLTALQLFEQDRQILELQLGQTPPHFSTWHSSPSSPAHHNSQFDCEYSLHSLCAFN